MCVNYCKANDTVEADIFILFSYTRPYTVSQIYNKPVDLTELHVHILFLVIKGVAIWLQVRKIWKNLSSLNSTQKMKVLGSFGKPVSPTKQVVLTRRPQYHTSQTPEI